MSTRFDLARRLIRAADARAGTGAARRLGSFVIVALVWAVAASVGGGVNGTGSKAPAIAWPTAYPNLTPTHVDVQWGTGPNEVLDIYAHPAGGSGRSVLFFLHFGCGVAGDHKQPALSGTGGGNALGWFLTEDTCQHLPVKFDFVSVNYEKFDWRVPTPVAHIAPWVPTINPTLYPENVDRLSALFTWATANSSTYGWDASKFHLMGVSHGAALAMLARLQNAVPVKTLIFEGTVPDYRDPLIAWPVGEGMYGMSGQPSWNAVPDAGKEAISGILEFSAGRPANYAPMYVLNATVGDGSTPYGFWPNGSYHDIAQWQQLVGALQACVPVSEWAAETYPRLYWETARTGVAVSRRVYEFMVAHE